MKNAKTRQSKPRPSARKVSKAVPAKKRVQPARAPSRPVAAAPKAPARKPAVPARKPVPAPARKAAVTQPLPIPPPTAAADRTSERILRELAEVRAALRRLTAPAGTTAEEALDESGTALRRVLSDAMEKRMEGVLGSVVAIRDSLLGGAAGQAEERLDRLIEELGGVAFTAARAEYFDPLIHALGAERVDASLPDGVVAGTLKPGVRTARGAVLSRALVAVNRRA